MTDWQARSEALQQQLDDLQNRFDILSGSLDIDNVPAVAQLTNSEAQLVVLLRNKSPGYATKQGLMDQMYAFRLGDDEPEIKIIDVYVCKLRKKLALHEITIDTVWGRGYAMSKPSAIKWDELCNG